MESIQNALNRHSPKEPPQVVAIKKYALDKHNARVTVRASKSHYILYAPSAALAQVFRFDETNITETCKLDKPLLIHIGSL